ncbi:hypothetical protein BM221_008505 [Beauveria bassiana]|uniref:Uncharacterized protein n=1 Tax=Beauveria bassiana TaxID=176275 RepID=A0A2N6ND42_BEABA|nr:hypothetical protein BM221_008505 [Beauveria bassiana]
MTPVSQRGDATYSHYEDTKEIQALNDFILENLDKKSYKPAAAVAAKTVGEIRAHVLSDRIAIVTPLSDQPVEISLVKSKGQHEEQVIKTADTYIILPDVRFRILPQGGNFHMAVLLLKNPETQ